MGGPSDSSPINQTCRGSAGSLSSAGDTWLGCEEAEELVYYSSTLCQVVFGVLHYADLIVALAPSTSYHMATKPIN